jgi:hypothetical protein
MRVIVIFAIGNQTLDAKGAAVNALGLTGRVVLAIGLGCALSAGVAMAAGSGAGYDGVYRGATTLDRGADPPCGKVTYPMSVTVVNGQFSIVWDPSRHVGINLQAQIDGSFSGTQAYTNGTRTAHLNASGHISGNTLDARVDGEYCSRNYHLTKG